MYLKKYFNLLNKTLYTSKWNFNRQRQKYFSNHPMNRNKIENCKILKKLFNDGIVVLPKYWDSKMIKKIKTLAMPIAKKLKNNSNSFDQRTVCYPKDGIYRLTSIEKKIPITKKILSDHYLDSIVEEYLGKKIKYSANYLDFKSDIGVHDYTTVPHMDSWMSQIKIFTLLNDVNNFNAPMVYWKGSHKDHNWRRNIDYFKFIGDDFGSTGTFPPALVREQENDKNNPLTEFSVLAPAGTVIIADVRGVHRASNLFKGYRLQIVKKFIS